MPTRFPTAPTQRRRPKSNNLQRWFILTLRFLFSPIVILVDAWRPRSVLDRTWLFYFFLFFTVVMGLTGIGIFVIEDPLSKTLQMMANLTDNREVLAGDLQPIIQAINRYTIQYNVDPNLVYAIIKSESSFQPMAVSASGARGLMQLMPEVWRQYSGSPCSGSHSSKVICHGGNCIFAPDSNIRTGVKYFRDLLDNYQGRVDLALEAYNAGITNVQPGMDPKFEETRGFVAKTLDHWQELRKSALNQQLKLALQLQKGMKWLFVTALGCWLILFWWASRKLFLK